MTISLLVEKADRIINLLEQIVHRMDSDYTDIPSIPVPSPTILGDQKCAECGIVFSGVMGYSCANSNCPVMVKVQ